MKHTQGSWSRLLLLSRRVRTRRQAIMASIAPLDLNAGNNLSWFAFALNVSLHFTQLPLMRVMLADADAASRSRYSHLPAIFQAAACAQWLGYGVFVLPSLPLVVNNAIGLAVSLVYIACFLRARPTFAERLASGSLWVLVVGFALLTYGVLYPTGPSRSSPARDMWAVSVTTAVTVLLWSSPLVALREAARELDVRRVPVPLTLVMFSATLAWLIAGLLVGDMALIVCSAFGVFFSGLQIVVMLWIRAQPPRPLSGNGGGGGGGDKVSAVVLASSDKGGADAETGSLPAVSAGEAVATDTAAAAAGSMATAEAAGNN
jgi:hypothetical protein